MRRRVSARGGLLALAAFGVGVWLGVTAGLATRAKQDQGELTAGES